MKITAQKTIQNPNSQMMSLFDENDICLGEIHKREHAQHIVKCVNSHDELVDAITEARSLLEMHNLHEVDLLGFDNKISNVLDIIEEALKAAGEEV